MRRRHALGSDRVIGTKRDASYLNCPGWIPLNAYHYYPYVLWVFLEYMNAVAARTATGLPE
jgi:hypothetical protein